MAHLMMILGMGNDPGDEISRAMEHRLRRCQQTCHDNSLTLVMNTNHSKYLLANPPLCNDLGVLSKGKVPVIYTGQLGVELVDR